MNYGLGNIQSVLNAVAYSTDESCTAIESAGAISGASKIILPGVGAFGEAMAQIRSRGVLQEIRAAAKDGVPILGICLGMQLLATRSHEFGLTEGLDLIPGEIRPFEETTAVVRIPHMGWNAVRQTRSSSLFHGVRDGADFYFAHSFYFDPADRDAGICVTDYGFPFVSAVSRGNVHGVQFHPEKSQQEGLRLIRNFLVPEAEC